ncbi:MAG: hypothetical protein AVDCRST_MAG08-3524, partial [uncultured Acetobacteraceae bacterium]
CALPERRRPSPALVDAGSPPRGGPSDCPGSRTRWWRAGRHTQPRARPPQPCSGSRPPPASPGPARRAT